MQSPTITQSIKFSASGRKVSYRACAWLPPAPTTATSPKVPLRDYSRYSVVVVVVVAERNFLPCSARALLFFLLHLPTTSQRASARARAKYTMCARHKVQSLIKYSKKRSFRGHLRVRRRGTRGARKPEVYRSSARGGAVRGEEGFAGAAGATAINFNVFRNIKIYSRLYSVDILTSYVAAAAAATASRVEAAAAEPAPSPTNYIYTGLFKYIRLGSESANVSSADEEREREREREREGGKRYEESRFSSSLLLRLRCRLYLALAECVYTERERGFSLARSFPSLSLEKFLSLACFSVYCLSLCILLSLPLALVYTCSYETDIPILI